MSVAEVRKALQQIRDRWKHHSPDSLFFPSDLLFNNMTMQEFAYKFVLGHVERRHHKGITSRAKAMQATSAVDHCFDDE